MLSNLDLNSVALVSLPHPVSYFVAMISEVHGLTELKNGGGTSSRTRFWDIIFA